MTVLPRLGLLLLATALLLTALPLAPAAATELPPVPTTPPVAIVGVVSMNALHDLDAATAKRDARRLIATPGVDVVGWQESENNRAVFRWMDRHGWQTRYFARGARELAVSWRQTAFSLASSEQLRMHGPSSRGRTTDPFPARWVTEVTLTHRATGQQATILNTHVNQRVEDWQRRPGHWRDTLNARLAKDHLKKLARLWSKATGRWIFGTGDLNFGYAADTATRTARGPSRALEGRAVNGYQVLATEGKSHPSSHRNIDYVYAGLPALAAGRMAFTDQRLLSGFKSDHRPLLATFALY